MEKKMETTLNLPWDNGKENGDYSKPLPWDTGKENGDYFKPPMG